MVLPKISCLTVTANRLVLLKEAIACYLSQTYSNRELVIVTAAGQRYRNAICDYLRWLGREDIRLVGFDAPKATLGALRNMSLDAAVGDLTCQWDDDDLYHPERLERQYDAMVRDHAEACFLTDHLQYFVQNRSMFWVDWRRFGGNLEKQMLPGSMLAVRHPRFRYPSTGASAQWGEDNAIRAIVSRNVRVATVSGSGYLYVYRCHGRNTMPDRHHNAITDCAGTGEDFLKPREADLRRALALYHLPSPYAVKIYGGQTLFTFRGAADHSSL